MYKSLIVKSKLKTTSHFYIFYFAYIVVVYSQVSELYSNDASYELFFNDDLKNYNPYTYIRSVYYLHMEKQRVKSKK